ncbi:MAG: glycosyltransferase family protein [Negativicutes bacterium]|nr:glycosyltransferase family protein [Negativicutes bacterium]
MKTVIIVQARMTSTRLPGKVMKEVLGKPLLEYMVERLKRVRSADEIVVATTANASDQPIVDLCARLHVPSFRGPEFDVLTRYHAAAVANHAATVVRVTSDCPLIDPCIIDQVIGFFAGRQIDYDYVSNVMHRTYPRGMDTEVFSFQALDEAFREATDEPDREHVTGFIERQPERYCLGGVCHFEDQSRHRWTVDTPEDFELIRRIIEAIYPSNPLFTMEDVLELLVRHPDWVRINAHIEQKQYGE